MAKVLCVLFDDPLGGYPSSYPKNTIPQIFQYPDGQALPTPQKIDFKPGELVGSVTGGLGLKNFLQELNHTFVVTSDKDGRNSVFEKELLDTEILISQPFWPAYLTSELIQKSKNLKLVITAGVGSDHIDLRAAAENGITVCEITYSNSVSVSEHVVMMILSLVRNYLPSHAYASQGGWNIADCVSRAYDLEGMNVATVGAGRIGLNVIKRLNAFDVKLHYHDRHRLSENIEEKYHLTYHPSVESLVSNADVVTINCPLHPETENLFDEKLISKMKQGAFLINTARGKICNTQAVSNALKSGHLAGYAGDVWYPQPAPYNHIWRTMPNNGMTPHISGATLNAQARYAAGVREILECWFSKKPIRNEYLIVDGKNLAGVGAYSYSIAKKQIPSFDLAN